MKETIKSKLLLIFTVISFLISLPTYASDQIIPHTVERLLKLCSDTRSEECQGQVALALDALESTGRMLYSIGVRTSERSVCFAEGQSYEDAVTEIIGNIRKKSYPSNQMAYAAIIEAAGELLKCDPSGTLIPLNFNVLVSRNCDGNWPSLASQADDAADAANQAEYSYSQLKRAKSDLDTAISMDDQFSFDQAKRDYDSAVSDYENHKHVFNSAVSNLQKCQ
jgi:hypothetical protein